MGPLELLECRVIIKTREYKHDFIVFQHMITPIILGIDFLRKYDIRISWGEQGRIKLRDGAE